LAQLLFFDLDDTLLDHRGAEEAAQRVLFARESALFAGLSFDDWYPKYKLANHAGWTAYGRGELDAPTVSVRRFAEPLAELGLDVSLAHALSVAYLEEYPHHWKLLPGAEEILDAASRNGVVGIISNGFSAAQKAKVKRFRLDRWVRHLILGRRRRKKPGRAIFEAARIAGRCRWRRDPQAPHRRSFEHDDGCESRGRLPVFFNPRKESHRRLCPGVVPARPASVVGGVYPAGMRSDRVGPPWTVQRARRSTPDLAHEREAQPCPFSLDV
jgi:FMN phosphatase YigB (HAD superfamily)